jgi:predicted short-subunit dehydrogenase-like oxidoreductase (DUF2520 family)
MTNSNTNYTPKVTLIGAGNVAHFMAKCISNAGLQIVQVYSRSLSTAQELALHSNAQAINQWNEINQLADIYIVALSDDGIQNFASQVCLPGKLVVHSSGILNWDLLQSVSENIGYMYPLQTLKKNIAIVNPQFPILIHGNNEESMMTINKFAGMVFEEQKLSILPIEPKRNLHVAAVFANNFVNFINGIAYNICQSNALDFEYLKPLIAETHSRALYHNPNQTQTGPALRNDLNTIAMHQNLLQQYPQYLDIYTQLTKDIQVAFKL